MFPRLLLILHLLAVASTAAPLASPSDAAAMRAISVAISASSSLNWSPSDDPCSWPLVTCSAGRVTAIQIGRRNLSGTLPTSAFSALTSLLRLELHFNSLSGPLPSLRGLSALQVVLLHHNLFSSVPPDFFSGLSSLQSISLDSNPFDPPWSLPSSLSNASTLVSFSANSCNLRGPFPSLFSPDNFPSLNHLALAYNSLSGPLPRSLAGSPLHSLWVNNQQGQDGVLSGPLDVIAEMPDLSELWLHSNNFSGPIPDLHKLGSLQVLNLRDNKLTGPVPASLIALNSLKNVTLTNNLLQGPVPVFPPGVNLELNVASESFCLSTPGDCDARVRVLLGIAGGFGYPAIFAENWKGNNPCNAWIGISCDRGGNVTVVNFKSMGLEGTISKEFAKLGSVQRVLLSGNKISGSIPEELTGLAELKEFDASNNLLTGAVPAFGKGVLVSLSGNPGLNNRSSSTGSPGSPFLGSGSTGSPVSGIGGDDGRKNSSVAPAVIVASVFGGIALLLCIGLLGFYVFKKKRNPFGMVPTPTTVIHPRHSNSDPDLVKITVASSSVNGATAGTTSESLSPTNSALGDIHVVESGNMVISIQVLRNVTNNFSHENIIGQGGFGTVYKGELHDGTKIAVKRMESGVMGSKGLTEFQSEIAVLTKVRHRHLVSLLGYCLDGNERLLVYEYMPQGTLSQHLLNWREECSKPLEWKKRLSIALDVARGVEYLHTLAHQSFIHRDLKPSNILLGDDMRAKVADFGLVRLAPDGKCSVETRLAGTFGYLAPEYAVTGRVTTKADVFSFGVILMELITGRKALDESQPEESIHLVTWFRRMQLSKESFKNAIDPTIDLDEETMASVSTVAELAGHCCAREPYQRPDMGHAVNVLSSLSEMWKPSDPDSEDSCGIDFDMTLPQALKKWQEFEYTTSSDVASSSFLASMDNTQTSIPTRPSGFADSFTSADGR